MSAELHTVMHEDVLSEQEGKRQHQRIGRDSDTGLHPYLCSGEFTAAPSEHDRAFPTIASGPSVREDNLVNPRLIAPYKLMAVIRHSAEKVYIFSPEAKLGGERRVQRA